MRTSLSYSALQSVLKNQENKIFCQILFEKAHIYKEKFEKLLHRRIKRL